VSGSTRHNSLSRIELLWSRGNELGESAVALYAKRLIELASIWLVALARGTMTATGIRGDGYVCTRSKISPTRGVVKDGSCNLMPENTRETYHGVLATVTIEIAATEADSSELQQYLSRL
jgi:hypothetical protein